MPHNDMIESFDDYILCKKTSANQTILNNDFRYLFTSYNKEIVSS